MAKSPINQSHHADGEVVLFEELLPVDLAFEEGVQTENRGTTISGEYGRTGFTEGLECHRFSAKKCRSMLLLLVIALYLPRFAGRLLARQLKRCGTVPVYVENRDLTVR